MDKGSDAANDSGAGGYNLKSGADHAISLESFSIRLQDSQNNPIGGAECSLSFPDGSSATYTSDDDGWITVTRRNNGEYVDIKIADREDDGDRRVYFHSALQHDDGMDKIRLMLWNLGFDNEENDVERSLHDFMVAYSLDPLNSSMAELTEALSDVYAASVGEEEDEDRWLAPSDLDETAERT